MLLLCLLAFHRQSELKPARARRDDFPLWHDTPRHPNDQAVGDVHDWTVWHGISEDADLAQIFTKGPTAEQVAGVLAGLSERVES